MTVPVTLIVPAWASIALPLVPVLLNSPVTLTTISAPSFWDPSTFKATALSVFKLTLPLMFMVALTPFWVSTGVVGFCGFSTFTAVLEIPIPLRFVTLRVTPSSIVIIGFLVLLSPPSVLTYNAYWLSAKDPALAST